MSVLVPDFKVFKYIHAGVLYAGYNSTCDSLYSHTMSYSMKEKDTHKEAKRLVTNWFLLNERSYDARYKEEGQTMLPFLQLNDTTKPEPVQLIKYLSCVLYNIEMETIAHKGEAVEHPERLTAQDWSDYNLLKSFLDDLKDSYIATRPEYETAKWSD